MENLKFTTTINASAAKVWQILWNDETYRKWTSAFHEGSYAVSDWKEGSRIQFLSPDGGGMYSVIAANRPNEYMAFKHLGEIKDFKEQPIDEKTKSWEGSMETYTLKEEDGVTSLTASLDATTEFKNYFEKTFPKAIDLVKKLSETPYVITIEATVATSPEKAWKIFNAPDHITKWNNASDDWHTTKAENDLRVGGKFLSRMEAKDGSFGFDFEGKYDDVKDNQLISYTIADGRKVKITFTRQGDSTKVTETFETETENPIEIQRSGWQAILDNFKKYVESIYTKTSV